MVKARITFGIIVFNGEPFIRYNLRSIYPFAHQIIIVEGACHGAAGAATADGHSRDNTLKTLRVFQATEDPDDKIEVVTAEDEGRPDGFWIEKDQMSQAYAKRATGNYLWQVDADEFYLPQDMDSIVSMIENGPGITHVSFPMKTFSGSPAYLVDGFYLRTNAKAIRRLFSWSPSYRYVTHRPPTVVDDLGRDLRQLCPVSAKSLSARGIFMYHYEQLFPKQVREKCIYYSSVDWSKELERANIWTQDCYNSLSRPFRVHMVYRHLSWIERFDRPVPPLVLQMVEAVRRGQHPGVDLRRSEDIEELLRSRTYVLGRSLLKACSPFYCFYRSCRDTLGIFRRQYKNRKGSAD